MEASTENYGNQMDEVMIDNTRSKFQLSDWMVFLAMLLASVIIGVVTAVKDRRKISPQEYLLGGRNMPQMAVVMSLLGGMVSAATILGNSTEIYFYGAQLVVMLLGFVLGMLIFTQGVLPILYDLQLVSVSEYLEHRYKSAVVRKAATLGFLLGAFILMSMNLYAPSLTLATVTNISTNYAMIIIGVIVTFYITIGGVKAVVYTDVLQTLVITGGLLAVVVLCCIDLGGINVVWTIAGRGGRLEIFNMDTNPYVRHTFWSTFALGVVIKLCYSGINQITFQRYASVSTLKASKRVGWLFMFGCWCLFGLIYLAGVVAYATYSTCDPLTSGKINKADQIIPFLVTDKLGYIPGMSGLFVAAVYGGVLSTLSSAGNSIACLVWEDFLKPFPFFSELNDSSATTILKILSIVAGALAVGLGMLMGTLGTIFHVLTSLLSAIIGPVSGLFLTGIFFPWVNSKGAVTGFLVSLSFSVWLVINTFLKGEGVPVPKVLSVAGCPTPLNTTMEASPSTNLDHEAEQTQGNISYCYLAPITIILTALVSGVVALLTGPICPSMLSKGVVNPTCERLYRWVWLKCQPNKPSRTTDGKQNHAL